MKNFVTKLFIIVLIFTSFVSVARAEFDLGATVDVPESCSVTDTDGTTHSYTAPSPDSYLAICALQAALDNGDISEVGLSNAFPDFGLFVVSINGASADPNSQFWALFQNGDFASLGLTTLPVEPGDEVKLDLQDFSGNSAGYTLTLTINSLITSTPPPTSGGGGGGGNSGIIFSSDADKTPQVLGAETTKTFDLDKAYEFLKNAQKEDGSFGENLYTDWGAVASASGKNPEMALKLVKYFSTTNFTPERLTDSERHAMALMALGLNPYNTNGKNYIDEIVKSFDGIQFGDIHENNDDIFALIVLQNAGYTEEDKIITDGIAFVLKAQYEDGSWNKSVDMTGAGIEALSGSSNEAVKTALEKAKNYLKEKQEEDGGWGNASSTAWAIEGITALGEKPEDWIKGKGDDKKSPIDYLTSIQDEDGGIKGEDLNNRIWQTSYVVSALSGKTWNEVMQTFPKQEPEVLGATIETPKHAVKPKVTAKKQAPKVIKNAAPSQPASVVESITPPTPPAPPAPVAPAPEQGWFSKLINFIF